MQAGKSVARADFRCFCIVGGGRESMIGLCGKRAEWVTFTARESFARCVQHHGMIGGKPLHIAPKIHPRDIQELSLGTVTK